MTITTDHSETHDVDPSRTQIYDYDRAGEFYSAWCLCGAPLANRMPHWGLNPADHPGCRDTVMDALAQHRAKAVAAQLPVPA